MTRYMLGLVLVLALGVMGCGETAGTGGSGGDAGTGGIGGSPGTAGTGGMAGGGGSAPPKFGFVAWSWAQPCDINASGQGLEVIIAVSDDDTPQDQLTYSGHVQDCIPDLNDMETTLTCDVNPGARESEATVTDPQGNEVTMPFSPETCVSDCAPGCPGKG